MQISFKKTIGNQEFTFTLVANTQKEFFEKVAFYASLPTTGPNGETDLVVTHRNPKGYNYYSIVSEKAGKELLFGQINDQSQTLFAKDWQDLYKENSAAVGTQVGGFMPTTQQVPQPVQQMPVQQAQPAMMNNFPQPGIPTQMAAPANVGFNPMMAPQVTAQPVQPAIPQPAAAPQADSMLNQNLFNQYLNPAGK